MQYDKFLYKSLKTYYNILSNIGYYNEDTDNLIIYIFLNNYIDIFSNNGFITDNDIKIINKATRCLQSCILKIPYLNESELFINNKIWQSKDIQSTSDIILHTDETDNVIQQENESNEIKVRTIE